MASSQPVIILSGDVKAAFDEPCMYWQFLSESVAALVEETLERTASGSLQGVRTPDECPFKRCVQQAVIESPWE